MFAESVILICLFYSPANYIYVRRSRGFHYFFRDRSAIIYLRRVARVRRAVRGGVTKHTRTGARIVLMPSSRLLAVTLKMTNYRRPPPGLVRSLPEDTRRRQTAAAFAETRARARFFYSSPRGQRSTESSSSSSFGVRGYDDGVITGTTVYGRRCRPSRDLLFFHDWPRFCNIVMVPIDKLYGKTSRNENAKFNTTTTTTTVTVPTIVIVWK